MHFILPHLRSLPAALLLVLLWQSGPSQGADEIDRPRARDIGLTFGFFPPGRHNAITDVQGVKVGHCTLSRGTGIRTGVTVIVPHPGNIFQEKVPAAIVVGNGFGKLVGVTQVEELGTLETPIALTNTLGVFTAANALVEYALSRPGNENVRSVNPVVGETNDGYLNDIRGRHLQTEHVLAALRAARSGPVAEGAVGAGTGTRCFGFKGGIGTASRHMERPSESFTLGVLVQSNFDGSLTIQGVNVGKELGKSYADRLLRQSGGNDGSCMIIVATDAPLDARQLKRLGRRALFGLGAIGSPMAHGSGDYVIVFSTAGGVHLPGKGAVASSGPVKIDDRQLTPLFQAAKEATEEAVLNSLFQASTTTGFLGRTVEAIPIDPLIDVCRRHQLLETP